MKKLILTLVILLTVLVSYGQNLKGVKMTNLEVGNIDTTQNVTWKDSTMIDFPIVSVIGDSLVFVYKTKTESFKFLEGRKTNHESIKSYFAIKSNTNDYFVVTYFVTDDDITFVVQIEDLNTMYYYTGVKN